ncbi:MAG: HpcH/HpaI aldolase family protein [Gammaproteobacteria bacterium]
MMTMTMAGALKTKWQKGDAAINGWLAIPCGFSAELMARQGWDSLTVDMQHGLVDYASAVQMLTAIATTKTVPLVRVPWLEEGIIMKMLDAGAAGIICPMINNRADAERLVCAARYPPRGRRSFGPLRARLCYGEDYHLRANDEVVILAMVETAEAVQNLDDILSVEGLDAIYVGPSDLSFSIGCKPTFDQTEEEPVRLINRIITAAKKHKVIAGIHNGTPAYARAMIKLGYQFVTISSDSRLLASGAAKIIGEMK